MKKKILFVDDEENLLRGVDRQLGDDYDLALGLGPYKGIELLKSDGPFGVIVVDMRMPGMDGITFLAQTRELAPTAVRMMLTGNADQETAVNAVNEGRVFRFVNKPVEREDLKKALEDCLAQHALIEAEKELLEKTLSGCVRVLVEILATVDPMSFGKAQILKTRSGEIGTALGLHQIWKIEMAAMLAQLGSITIPPSLVLKRKQGNALPAFESGLVERIPIASASLLSKIPRLEEIAQIVLYQDKCFDGAGIPPDAVKGTAIPIAARILKVLKDFGELESDGLTAENAFRVMHGRIGWYDDAVLQLAAEKYGRMKLVRRGRPVTAKELRPGMLLTADVVTTDGMVLIGEGQTLSEVLLARLSSYASLEMIHEPIMIEAPRNTLQPRAA